ncbi:methylmalonyl Co-A mutase-associated GTPase MeaB [Microlunatus parietis]|uniref:LAO/AO transport system kinase n=1 Tax=Microlunatus parietis TaxID=682979 RepID=A0A7Y9IEM3_9ACTN|nr:methylmalonyl Co-A mutase-associated GTPase MeaB [Microlunatus parietis]NYE75429.1 LAO/AO transport system kinase [Microlunatus parietis]
MIDPETVRERLRAGDRRLLARVLSAIEDDAPVLRDLAAALAPATGHAYVIGLTGAPGVGKSSVTAELIGALRARGDRVGVLAVDPSSPFSGGALLGDRVRMQEYALDDAVFIRSMASRGHLGGLSAAAPQALRGFDAAGYDVVLVETVGVGQSEVEVARIADACVVLLAPGMGDGVQAAKAGVLEIGDLFVVNKADRDGAQSLIRELRGMVALADHGPDDWKPPIVRTVATTGEGIADLVGRLDRFRAEAERTGRWQDRRLGRAETEVSALALASLRRRLGAADSGGGDRLVELAEDVRDGRLDPYAAADRLVAARE